MEQKSAYQVSRRGFVAAAGAAALAAGVCASRAHAEEPAASAAPAEGWDYATDVVICGLGVAGAMGAREAILQGMSCIVVEAAPRELAGGSSKCFGGYYVPSPAESLMGGALDETAAAAVADEAAAEFGWMLANGLPVGEIMKVEGAGRGFYATLDAAVEAMGTPVLYGTRATELIEDKASGEVVGVVAQTEAGEQIRLLARKGVLLATGSVSGNPELMGSFFFPNVPVLNAGSPYEQGDGLLMATALGARLQSMNRFGVELQNLALTKASEELGTAMVCYPMSEAAGARLIVNGSGARFMNEQMDLAHYKGLCPWLEFPGAPQLGGYQGYVNLPMYLVFDAQLAAAEPLGEGLVDYGWALSTDAYDWSADNQAEVEAGWIATGNTIEELVENLAAQSGNAPIDAAALQATIDAFNAAAQAGEPDQYGRTDARPLGEPPYYAAELSMTLMYTIGGLAAEGAEGRTLDGNGAHIPGLWHAGDVGQPCSPNVLGCCPAGATGALAVRDIAASPAREVAGEVANEIAPVDAQGQGFAVAQGGFAALQQ